MLEKLRFPARTAAFAGLTFTLYGLLEIDTALAPKEEHEAILQKWIERYGKGLLRLYGVDVIARGPYIGEGRRYPGRDARGKGRIFVMNHRSGLDVPVTLAYVEATIVSRADLAGWPIIGMAARRVGTLFVDRSNKSSGAAVISAMTSALERGKGVMVYPEGTTFSGDEVRPFRAGGFKAAEQAGAEVIPIGIAYEGEGASFVDEPFTAHMIRVSTARGVRAALCVGEPLMAGEEDVDALMNAARASIQELVHSARALLSGGS
jgi:1-acyl-sn-glycerol-3-phosphate acyltransferase